MKIASARPRAIKKTGEGVERHQESLKQKNAGQKNCDYSDKVPCRMRAALFSIASKL
jgi:hypothetical protein